MSYLSILWSSNDSTSYKTLSKHENKLIINSENHPSNIQLYYFVDIDYSDMFLKQHFELFYHKTC